MIHRDKAFKDVALKVKADKEYRASYLLNTIEPIIDDYIKDAIDNATTTDLVVTIDDEDAFHEAGLSLDCIGEHYNIKGRWLYRVDNIVIDIDETDEDFLVLLLDIPK